MRKVLKEEKELRDWIKGRDLGRPCCDHCGSDTLIHDKKCPWHKWSRLITALVRAVREECVQRMMKAYAEDKFEDGIAAAIRRGK